MIFPELAALAITMNVYMESRGEPLQCSTWVAETVINRRDLKRKDVFEIVMDRKQYSWTNNLKRRNLDALLQLNKDVIERMEMNTGDFKAYIRAGKIAQDVLSRPTKTRFTHFHKVGYTPAWSIGKTGVRCGNHIFYKGIAW